MQECEEADDVAVAAQAARRSEMLAHAAERERAAADAGLGADDAAVKCEEESSTPSRDDDVESAELQSEKDADGNRIGDYDPVAARKKAKALARESKDSKKASGDVPSPPPEDEERGGEEAEAEVEEAGAEAAEPEAEEPCGKENAGGAEEAAADDELPQEAPHPDLHQMRPSWATDGKDPPSDGGER